jgi:hypothetical protein
VRFEKKVHEVENRTTWMQHWTVRYGIETMNSCSVGTSVGGGITLKGIVSVNAALENNIEVSVSQLLSAGFSNDVPGNMICDVLLKIECPCKKRAVAVWTSLSSNYKAWEYYIGDECKSMGLVMDNCRKVDDNKPFYRYVPPGIPYDDVYKEVTLP